MKYLTSQKQDLKIDVTALITAAPFAAVNDIRFYLNGICVLPVAGDGVVAIATNGHAFICVRDRNGFAQKTTILPISAKRNKSALRRGAKICMSESGTIYAEVNGEVEFIVPEAPLEGKFPNLAAIFGHKDQWQPGIPAAFSLAYLKLVGNLGRYAAVSFWHKQQEGVGIFTIGPDIVGGIMPLKDSRQDLTAVVPHELWAPPVQAKEG